MIKELQLQNFKSFQDATLRLGPFTVLIGTNASGKSNIRDAFRFLHGVGRGYSLADIFGEKPAEGWAGIRGGPREISFAGAEKFSLQVTLDVAGNGVRGEATYRLEVQPGRNGEPSRVVAERLALDGDPSLGFDSSLTQQKDPIFLAVAIPKEDGDGQFTVGASNLVPLLTRLMDPAALASAEPGAVSPHILRMGPWSEAMLARTRQLALLVGLTLRGMRFMDLSPDAMRQPSVPGQVILSDRGGNLSSVLSSICRDQKRKRTLLSWLEELTPTDVKDLEFPADQIGRVLVTLVEGKQEKTSAYSASDGTLRFLAWLAMMFGPDPARFYFAEELENGIHPARLSLLTKLIEQNVKDGRIQVVGTSHSPQLLGVMREAFADTSLVYRLPEHRESGIVPLLDVPTAREVLERHSVINLQESGWFEDTMFFAQPDEDESTAGGRKRSRGKGARPATDEAAA